MHFYDHDHDRWCIPRSQRARPGLVRAGSTRIDPLPVQRTLQRAAAVIRELRRERDVLAARVAEVEAVLSEPLEAHRVAEALGAEATQVLEAAHAAAAERAERAEREAEAIRAEALTAADTTRAEAIAAREETLLRQSVTPRRSPRTGASEAATWSMRRRLFASGC